MFNIDKQKINISCPKCDFENSVTFKQIEDQESIICNGCRCSIKLVDKDGSVRRGIKNVNQEMNKLTKSLKDIKIDINI